MIDYSIFMDQTIAKQASEAIGRATRILIAIPRRYTIDALASACALGHVLAARGTRADIVADGYRPQPHTDFLRGSLPVYGTLYGVRQMVISLPVAEQKITDFSYDVKDGMLSIMLTPERGTFDEKSVAVSHSGYRYDLIIAIDADTPETLGDTHALHRDFFFSIPVVNVAHRSTNEHFGQINAVDLTASSCAEIVYDLIRSIDAHAVAGDVATCVLAGIMNKTKGFKTQAVTPRTLTLAAQLMEHGAQRDVIVKNLFQTKSLNTLKLWGKTLARLKSDGRSGVAWSFLQAKDFDELGALPEQLTEVVDELIVNAPEAEIICVFYEHPAGKVHGLIYSNRAHDSLALVKPFKPFGDAAYAHIELEQQDLVAAGKTVIDYIISQKTPRLQ